MFCKKKIDIINILEAKVKNRVNNSCCEVMVREFARDYMRQCSCAHVVSYSPNSRTPEQERRYRRSLRADFKKKNAEREKKIRDFPALVQRGIITPLDTEYQARKRQQEEDARIHAERMRRLREMQRERRQRRLESAISIVAEKSDNNANVISGASTEEQQQAVARAAGTTLSFKP